MQAIPALDVRKHRERAAHTRLMLAHERALEHHLARIIAAAGHNVARMRLNHGAHGQQVALGQIPGVLRGVLRPSLMATARDFAERLQHGIKAAGGWEAKAFDDLDQAVQDAIDEHVGTRITQITESMRAAIVEVIRRGTAEGWSETEIAAGIEDATSGEIAGWRARRIARTETHTAANMGQWVAAQASPLDFMKEWLSTEDARTREDHANANGQQVEMCEPFVLGGADPSQNGRFSNYGGVWRVTAQPYDPEQGPPDERESSAGLIEMMYPGDPTAPPEQIINCFPAGTLVSGRALAATRHWYVGELIELTFASGRKLSGTPNHPILGRCGWLPLQSVKQGDDFAIDFRPDRGRAGRPDVDHADVPIEQVFDALAASGNLERISRRKVNFHGDRPAHDVDIVRSKGELVNGIGSGAPQLTHHFEFAGPGLAQCALFGFGALRQILLAAFHAANGVMRRFYERFAAVWAGICHPLQHCFGTGARANANVIETPANRGPHNSEFMRNRFDRRAAIEAAHHVVANAVARLTPARSYALRTAANNASRAQMFVDPHRADANGGRNFAEALAGRVELDRVTDVSRREFSGHVFNLETDRGWYIAQGIVTHNCRCTCIYVPIVNETGPRP